LTWTPPQDAPALVEPVCQAALLRWETAGPDRPGLLLFSNPADPKKRVNLTVRASADDGVTWPHTLVLHPGPAAYSSLVALDAAHAGCLYENGSKRAYERITFARFQRSDLLESTP
jgi:sialidase-1